VPVSTLSAPTIFSKAVRTMLSIAAKVIASDIFHRSLVQAARMVPYAWFFAAPASSPDRLANNL